MSITYSIVVPLKDEEGNIEQLITEIETAMLGQQKGWELICIDDGSRDQTLSLLKRLKEDKPYLRILVFSQNFGQTSAFDAGFRLARGEFVITLDGDRQNDPQDIPKLISLSDRYDLICGVRQKRKDTFFKRWISYLANSVRSRVCEDGVTDTGCSLKLYRKACLDKIKLFHGMHRFLPALFLIEGYSVGQLPVSHRERTRGKTKYTLLNRSFNTIADLCAVWWMKKRRLNYVIKEEL